jgi:hypothetical protein
VASTILNLGLSWAKIVAAIARRNADLFIRAL